MAPLQSVRDAIQKRLSAAADEIFVVFFQTVVQYEEEIERQRILLDAVLKPKVRLYRTDLAQEEHHTTEEEEAEEQGFISDQLLSNQEKSSTVLDDEVSKSPQIKQEPEEVWMSDFTEQPVQEQYHDEYMLTYSQSDNDKVKDNVINSDESPSAAKEELDDISVEKFNPSELPFETCAAYRSFKYPTTLISPQRRQIGEPFKDAFASEVQKTTIAAGRNSSVACRPDLTKNDSLNVPEGNHTGVPSFSLDMYGKASTSIPTLPKSSHTGEKPHSCGICGTSYKKKSHLVVHYRVHTGERPYCCIVCGKFFRSTKNLNVHRKIHTGERPYSCDTCGKRFITNSKLSRHKRTHTIDKPYPCDICGTTFKYMQTLKMHYRVHTEDA